MEKKVDWKMVIVYVIFAIIILAVLVFTFFPGMIYAVKDSGVIREGSENSDICDPPAGSGYTEESWREHMSHHPNIYRDCL